MTPGAPDSPACSDLHASRAGSDARVWTDAHVGVLSARGGCDAVLASEPYRNDALPHFDVAPEELEIARRSAEELAEMFPQFPSCPETDVLRVSNVDVVDLILCRGLTSNDDDVNPDPSLAIPDSIAARVVRRRVADGARALRPAIEARSLPRKRPAAAVAAKSSKRARLTAPSAAAKTSPPVLAYSRIILGGDTAPSSSMSGRDASPPALPRPPDATADALSLRPSSLVEHERRAPSPASVSSAVLTIETEHAPAECIYTPVPFDRRELTYICPDNAELIMPVPAPAPEKKKTRHHPPAYYERRKTAYYQSQSVELWRPALHHDAHGMPAVMISSLNRSRPGWRGHIKADPIRRLAAVWGKDEMVEMLGGFKVVPFRGLNTAICDMSGRAIVYRTTPVQSGPGYDLVDAFAADARIFSKCTLVSESERLSNARGDHFFAIMGIHRQYRSLPFRTLFSRQNREAVDWLFRAGGPARRLTNFLTVLIETRFPRIADRMKRNHAWHLEQTKESTDPLVPEFGLFWNFCLNAPSPEAGVKRVVCKPHADQMNCAVLLCAVFAFWDKEWLHEDEWSWLVIWELGIILQCPRGSFILYPSALLLHFNIRIVKCKQGERPTKDNSEEYLGPHGAGRGSAVWFTQATMHSGTDERNSKGRLPDYERLAEECFPVVLPLPRGGE